MGKGGIGRGGKGRGWDVEEMRRRCGMAV